MVPYFVARATYGISSISKPARTTLTLLKVGFVEMC